MLRIIILSYIIGGCTGAYNSDQTVKVSRIANCPGEVNPSINLTGYVITQVNKTTYHVNGYLEVLENITDHTFIGKLSIMRCQDMRNVDRCVVFIEDLKDRDICNELDHGFFSKSQLLREVKPPVRCPVYAGKYYSVNTTLDAAFVSPTVLGSNIKFLLIRAVFYYHKRRIMCTDAWVQLGAKRNTHPRHKEVKSLNVFRVPIP